MCVLIFSTAISETFLILGRIQLDVIITSHRSLCIKYLLFVLDFNGTWMFSIGFRKIPKYQITTIRPAGAELFQADRRKGRPDKLIVVFR
jgi:hypothetical protein